MFTHEALGDVRGKPLQFGGKEFGRRGVKGIVYKIAPRVKKRGKNREKKSVSVHLRAVPGAKDCSFAAVAANEGTDSHMKGISKCSDGVRTQRKKAEGVQGTHTQRQLCPLGVRTAPF